MRDFIEEYMHGALWLIGIFIVIGLFIFGINHAAELDDIEFFKKECSEVQGDLRTLKNGRLACYKDGVMIAKHGFNSPKAPMVEAR